MILNRFAILKLHGVSPRYLKGGEIRQGEPDHFHVLGVEGGKWFFYRRIREQLLEGEKESLMSYSSDMGMQVDLDFSKKVMRTEVPKLQGDFYHRINNTPGCRVYPVTLQSQGNVYASIEYDETKSGVVTSAIMDYLERPLPYKRSIAYMSRRKNDFPYLLSLYSTLGNSLQDFHLIRTVWNFQGDEEIHENEGVFQNRGDFVIKQYTDKESESLIWRMDSDEIAGNSTVSVVNKRQNVVETKLRNRFFSDFYATVLKGYSGGIFFGARCEGNRLINHFIVEGETAQIFLSRLFSHWNMNSRKLHSNYLLEVRKLLQSQNQNDFPF